MDCMVNPEKRTPEKVHLTGSGKSAQDVVAFSIRAESLQVRFPMRNDIRAIQDDFTCTAYSIID